MRSWGQRGLWSRVGTGCRRVGSERLAGAVERQMICRLLQMICRLLQIRASRERALHHAFEHRDQRIGRNRGLKIRQTLLPALGLQSVNGGLAPRFARERVAKPNNNCKIVSQHVDQVEGMVPDKYSR